MVKYSNEYLFDLSSSEDVVQEVFVYLWENSNKINIMTSLKSYLYAAVRNRCLNVLKKNKITDNAKILDAQVTFSNDYDSDSFSEEEKQFLYEQLHAIIENFPLKMRAIGL